MYYLWGGWKPSAIKFLLIGHAFTIDSTTRKRAPMWVVSAIFHHFTTVSSVTQWLIDSEPCGLFTDEETNKDKFIFSPANGTDKKIAGKNLRVFSNTSEWPSPNSTRKTRHQRSARNGDDVFTDIATPAKCRERHWFLALDFLRQRRTRRRNGFQPMTYYASEEQGAALISGTGFSTPEKKKAQK